MLIVPESQSHEFHRAQRAHPPVELLGGDVVLLVVRIPEAEDRELDVREGVRRQGLAQQEPPELSHVRRRVALARGAAHAHDERRGGQLGHLERVHGKAVHPPTGTARHRVPAAIPRRLARDALGDVSRVPSLGPVQDQERRRLHRHGRASPILLPSWVGERGALFCIGVETRLFSDRRPMLKPTAPFEEPERRGQETVTTAYNYMAIMRFSPWRAE